MSDWHGIITARGGFPWATIEDAVASKLREMGYRTWLPREKRPTKQRPDLSVPMVRGYVFAAGDIDWPAVRKIKGFIRPLRRVDDTLAVITQAQIDRMRAVCADLAVEISKPKLRPGDRVRIRKGALADIEAVILSATKAGHVVEYQMLGKAFRQEIAGLIGQH